MNVNDRRHAATRLLVIADDFTGSIDTGVQLAKAGVAASVYAFEDEESLWEMGGGREVAVVVNTESRHLSAEDAYLRVTQVVECFSGSGQLCLYKKTDSTLRGNIGAELSAALRACGARRLVFAPALPALGRTTKNGVQYVKGVPLAETEFAHDPFNPVQRSRVADIIAQQTEIPVAEFTADSLKADGDGPCILLANAETQADLMRIGTQVRRADALECLAGCAGFAEVLPALLEIRPQEISCPHAGPGRLLVCGSVHPMAEQQCNEAVRSCGYEPFEVAARDLVLQKTTVRSTFLSMRSRLLGGGKALLRVQGGRDGLAESRSLGAELEIPAEEVSKRIALGLGAIAAELMENPFAGTLTVFGGDTLQGVSQMLKIQRIAPIREIATGVVMSLAESKRRQFLVVTKAGAFGERDVVQQIDGFLDQSDGQG